MAMPSVATLKTFPDAGVLIEAARGTGANQDRALRIIEAPGKNAGRPRPRFLGQRLSVLEVVPKAAFNKRTIESSFYERFFRQTEWVRDLDRPGQNCSAGSRGGNASWLGRTIDALHLAAAHLAGTGEFITTERRTSPLYRFRLVKVAYLYE
jgi:hypothetical protein